MEAGWGQLNSQASFPALNLPPFCVSTQGHVTLGTLFTLPSPLKLPYLEKQCPGRPTGLGGGNVQGRGTLALSTQQGFGKNKNFSTMGRGQGRPARLSFWKNMQIAP